MTPKEKTLGRALRCAPTEPVLPKLTGSAPTGTGAPGAARPADAGRRDISLVGHLSLGYQCQVRVANQWQTELRPRKNWTGLIAVLVALACAFGAAAADKTKPAHAPSPADRKLLRAIDQADVRLLESAIAEGANPNCLGTNSLPPLLELFRTAAGPLDDDHRECIAALLEHGATVDPKDADGRTPLIQAARIGDLKTVRLLVQAEAYVMARDRFHKSALFYAVEANRRDIVLYLAANGDLVSLTVKERKALR